MRMKTRPYLAKINTPNCLLLRKHTLLRKREKKVPYKFTRTKKQTKKKDCHACRRREKDTNLLLPYCAVPEFPNPYTLCTQPQPLLVTACAGTVLLLSMRWKGTVLFGNGFCPVVAASFEQKVNLYNVYKEKNVLLCGLQTVSNVIVKITCNIRGLIHMYIFRIWH